MHRFRIRVCKTEHRQVPVPQNEATGEEDLTFCEIFAAK